ncbi:hypothetical protein HK101_001958 [Irineochytrium annulatum]|nr:hypothetical protein HK101_001958 [Irineochytrium annulatum]
MPATTKTATAPAPSTTTTKVAPTKVPVPPLPFFAKLASLVRRKTGPLKPSTPRRRATSDAPKSEDAKAVLRDEVVPAPPVTKLERATVTAVKAVRKEEVVTVKEDGPLMAKLQRTLSAPPAFGSLRKTLPSGRVVAIHAWEARLPDQMDINVGDRITISNHFNDGWALGTNETSHFSALFPVHCVENERATSSSDSVSAKSVEAAATPTIAAAAEEEEDNVEPGDVGSGWKQVAGIWVRE